MSEVSNTSEFKILKDKKIIMWSSIKAEINNGYTFL